MNKRDRRNSAYAAKFAAETVSAEPPRWVEPTHCNLEKILSQCARVPKESELAAIRDQFLHGYSRGEYGPQLPSRRMTYHCPDHGY